MSGSAAKATAGTGGGMQILKWSTAYFVKKDYGSFKVQLSTNIDMQTCYAVLNGTRIEGEIIQRKRTNCYFVLDSQYPGTYEVTIDQGLSTEIKNTTSLSFYDEKAEIDIIHVDCVDAVVKCKLDGFQGATQVVLKNGKEKIGSTLVTSSSTKDSIASFQLKSSEYLDLFCTIDGEEIGYSKTTHRSESLQVKCQDYSGLSGSTIALIVLVILVIICAFVIWKFCSCNNYNNPPIELGAISVGKINGTGTMDNESAKDANEHSQIGNASTTNGVQHPSHIENRTNILDLQAT